MQKQESRCYFLCRWIVSVVVGKRYGSPSSLFFLVKRSCPCHQFTSEFSAIKIFKTKGSWCSVINSWHSKKTLSFLFACFFFLLWMLKIGGGGRHRMMIGEPHWVLVLLRIHGGTNIALCSIDRFAGATAKGEGAPFLSCCWCWWCRGRRCSRCFGTVLRQGVHDPLLHHNKRAANLCEHGGKRIYQRMKEEGVLICMLYEERGWRFYVR